MSRENWEKLVAAVIKKQQVWELFHSQSRNTSFSSVSTTDFSSTFSEIDPSFSIRRFKQPILEINFDEVLKSANFDGPVDYNKEDEHIQDKWEQYEPGVYMTRSITGEVKRVQFSGIIFDAVQAKTWWFENREEVGRSFRNGHEKFIEQKQEAEARWSVKKWKFYKVFSQSQTTQVRQTTISGTSKATPDKKKLSSKDASEEYIRFKGFLMEEPILEINFNTITEKSDGHEPDICGERIKRYEAGVYLTISTLKDGTVNVERVRFSRNIFDAEQVKTWWIENQSDVYGRYNARDL